MKAIWDQFYAWAANRKWFGLGVALALITLLDVLFLWFPSGGEHEFSKVILAISWWSFTFMIYKFSLQLISARSLVISYFGDYDLFILPVGNALYILFVGFVMSYFGVLG